MRRESHSMGSSIQYIEQVIVHGEKITFCLGAKTKGCSTDTQSWYNAYAGTCMASAHGRPSVKALGRP